MDNPFAPATERNSRPILGVLRYEFRHVNSVLEIGSGTGQHAVTIASELSHLSWQTSDLEINHAGIRAWIDAARLRNVLPPLVLDVNTARMNSASYDAVFSANTAHIMSFGAVKKMFALVAAVLHDAGVFCLYGPFRQDGQFNTQSNRNFDQSLRQQDPQMGIRDLEDLDTLGLAGNLERRRLYAMPANNQLAVWQKRRQGDM